MQAFLFDHGTSSRLLYGEANSCSGSVPTGNSHISKDTVWSHSCFNLQVLAPFSEGHGGLGNRAGIQL